MCSALASSVSPTKLLQRFAHGLARVEILRNITLQAIWQASFLENCKQADQCNNSGETGEVSKFWLFLKLRFHSISGIFKPALIT